MNSQDLETLSALLDGEADELELRRVLKAVASDPQIAEAWERMSLVQAVLHDDNLNAFKHPLIPNNNVAVAVAQAIADEPVPELQGGEASGPARWTQPLAKLGIAASVAFAFFLGMQTTINSPAGDLSAPVAQQSEAEFNTGSAPSQLAVSLTEAAVTESAPREVDPEARQRLEEYIQSVSITREEPQQLEQLQDSPLYRLVNENQGLQ